MKKIYFLISIFFISGFLNSAEAEPKKFEFEISTGFSFTPFIEDLQLKSEGAENMLKQYCTIFNTNYSKSGEYKIITQVSPFNLTINLNLNQGFYFKAGVEYGSKQLTSDFTYTANINNVLETHSFTFTPQVTTIMPFIGIEKRFSNFGLFANFGYGFITFNHLQEYQYKETGYSRDVEEKIEAKSSALGINIGAKYLIKITKNIKALVRIEYLMLYSGSFAGTKTTNISDSANASELKTQEGGLYTYESNPYQLGWFNSWDLFSNPPREDILLQNAKLLKLNLSQLRLMFGIMF